MSDLQYDELLDIPCTKSAVTKPAVGFFDLASNLSEGMLFVVLRCVVYDTILRKASATLQLFLIVPPGNV